MRKANEIIKGEGLTWADVLASQHAINLSIGLATRKDGPFGMAAEDMAPVDMDDPPHLRDKVMIPMMFRAIYAQPAGNADPDFWIWLDSVHQHWLDHQRLSVKQYQGVRRSYNRVVRSAAST